MDAPKKNLEREAQGLDHQHPVQQRTSHGVARLVNGMAAVQAHRTCCVRDLGTREFGHGTEKRPLRSENLAGWWLREKEKSRGSGGVEVYMPEFCLQRPGPRNILLVARSGARLAYMRLGGDDTLPFYFFIG